MAPVLCQLRLNSQTFCFVRRKNDSAPLSGHNDSHLTLGGTLASSSLAGMVTMTRSRSRLDLNASHDKQRNVAVKVKKTKKTKSETKPLAQAQAKEQIKRVAKKNKTTMESVPAQSHESERKGGEEEEEKARVEQPWFMWHRRSFLGHTMEEWGRVLELYVSRKLRASRPRYPLVLRKAFPIATTPQRSQIAWFRRKFIAKRLAKSSSEKTDSWFFSVIIGPSAYCDVLPLVGYSPEMDQALKDGKVVPTFRNWTRFMQQFYERRSELRFLTAEVGIGCYEADDGGGTWVAEHCSMQEVQELLTLFNDQMNRTPAPDIVDTSKAHENMVAVLEAWEDNRRRFRYSPTPSHSPSPPPLSSPLSPAPVGPPSNYSQYV